MNIAEIYSNKVNEEAHAKAAINLPSGQLTFGTYSLKHGKIANKQVKPGTYDVNAFFIDEDDMDNLNASVGLNMVIVNFSEEPITRWEEAKDVNGEDLVTYDDFEYLMYDQAQIDDLETKESDIEELKNYAYSEGLVAFKNNEVTTVYIGEDAASHKLYWALDAENNPVKLVGYFEYNFN